MKRRSGSALLLVILLLTVVSVLSVTAARVLILNSRQSASYDVTNRARQAAQAGVEEAVARLNNSAKGLDAFGEFGTYAFSTGSTGGQPASNYFTPLTRYLTGDSCATLSTTAQLTSASNCSATYTLWVWNSIAIASASSSSDIAAFNAQAFQPADFPSGKLIGVPVPRGTNFIFQVNPTVSSVSYQMCSSAAHTSCTTLNTANGTTQISLVGDDSNTAGTGEWLFVSFTYPTPISGALLTFDSSTNYCTPEPTTQLCMVGKGYTSAEIVGSAGTAQVHYIIEQHPNSSSNGLVIRETSQHYNGRGIRLPS